MDLHHPVGVLQQRPPHGDEVEVAAVQSPFQLIKRRRLRTRAAEGFEEVAGEAHGANGYRGDAQQLLDPTGEVEVGAVEFRLPEPPLRAVDDVGARVDQGAQPGDHLVGGARQAGGEVLLLPLRDAQDDRIVRADLGADGFQDVGGEAAALGDGRAAVAVVAAVDALPEELVDQVAVGAVELDGVEAHALRVPGGLGEGGRWRRRHLPGSSARRTVCSGLERPEGLS